jgi:hypothetical protein
VAAGPAQQHRHGRALDAHREGQGQADTTGRAVRAEEAGDLFREGMLRVARATGKAERAWLSEAIERLGAAD